MEINAVLLQKRMHFNPGIESQHLANSGLRQPLRAVALKGQCLKCDPRRVLALASDLPCEIVRDIERDFHGIKNSTRCGRLRNVCFEGAQYKTLSAAAGVACEGTDHLSRS